MSRLTTIHIHNQYLKFSAAHFTIFSATERERLHGHNFAVTADITAQVGDDGLCFDYNIMKKRLRGLCDGLDEYVLMPAHSPFLSVAQTASEVSVTFNGETLRFPASDTIVMPLANITAEELSHWLLQQMLRDDVASTYGIHAMRVTVGSGYGQSASSEWPSNEQSQ
ncbi:MAG: 6-carboxytetrahydropterin synthase [Pseudomonadota bacterium]